MAHEQRLQSFARTSTRSDGTDTRTNWTWKWICAARTACEYDANNCESVGLISLFFTNSCFVYGDRLRLIKFYNE